MGRGHGGVPRAPGLSWGAGGTGGSFKSFGDGVRVGPGGDLVRRLGRAPSLRALRPRCRLADGPFRPEEDYARRDRPYRREHFGRRRDDRALAGSPVLGGRPRWG